jgi:hypothetical protein
MDKLKEKNVNKFKKKDKGIWLTHNLQDWPNKLQDWHE